jgi:hypothetical protein
MAWFYKCLLNNVFIFGKAIAIQGSECLPLFMSLSDIRGNAGGDKPASADEAAEKIRSCLNICGQH